MAAMEGKRHHSLCISWKLWLVSMATTAAGMLTAVDDLTALLADESTVAAHLTHTSV